MKSDTPIERRFNDAAEWYSALGIDASAAIDKALTQPISLHCWQSDDGAGLENPGRAIASGGLVATGNFPGRARNGDEIRADIGTALKLLPGKHRLNLHACYAEGQAGEKVERNKLELRHFSRWLDWAKSQQIGFDFNTTFYNHPYSADGFTLSNANDRIREFWVDHGIACRKIADAAAKVMGQPVVLNHWIPDGMKDSTADRWSPRARLVKSLDAMLDAKHGVDRTRCIDAVEGKLFGIGYEDYTVGSTEFYSQYALSRGVLLCLDMGHFHPTEGIADKLSAYLQFLPQMLIHVSRPIRWDSDHVVILNDDLKAVFDEVARGKAYDRVKIALDYFDASINRVAAYVIGVRATRQAILMSLLQPNAKFTELESAGKGAQKLAWMEVAKTQPFGAIWDMLCLRAGVPTGGEWIAELEQYEKRTIAERS